MNEKKDPKELAKIVTIFRKESEITLNKPNSESPPISDEKLKRKLEVAEKMRRIINENKPWLKSTGAKTPEGKRRSSQNAYKHGRYSKAMRQVNRLVHEFTHKVKEQKLIKENERTD
jgi:hypothetical protein